MSIEPFSNVTAIKVNGSNYEISKIRTEVESNSVSWGVMGFYPKLAARCVDLIEAEISEWGVPEIGNPQGHRLREGQVPEWPEDLCRLLAPRPCLAGPINEALTLVNPACPNLSEST
ncbi:hypothetical protein [Bradyrhizobium zhanjiangense]|uniref:hypothetical protein n=1 Tax=Bradyrhizobium zhanjiangense TaxID=1325107 RepID=UPI001008CBB1|nr:hypothetical protein [Bradyrhizobium zhanjiangense]